MSEPDPGQAVPRQPWLHELAIAVDGNATLLCAWDGSVGAISSAGGTAETGDRPTKAGPVRRPSPEASRASSSTMPAVSASRPSASATTR